MRTNWIRDRTPGPGYLFGSVSRHETVILALEEGRRRKDFAGARSLSRTRYATVLGLLSASLAMSACVEADPELQLLEEMDALAEAGDKNSDRRRRVARVALQLSAPTQQVEFAFHPEAPPASAVVLPQVSLQRPVEPRSESASNPAEELRRLFTQSRKASPVNGVASPSSTGSTVPGTATPGTATPGAKAAKSQVPSSSPESREPKESSPAVAPRPAAEAPQKFSLRRIHSLAATPPQMQVEGDFAEYRGVDEALVWAYAGVQEPRPTDLLDVGECRRESQLTRDFARPHSAPSGPEAEGGNRGIELLDVGPLQLRWGQERYDVPMRLAPEILTYASGVQYRGQHRVLPHARKRNAERPSALSLQWNEAGAAIDRRKEKLETENLLQSLSLPMPSPLQIEVHRPDAKLIKKEDQSGYELPRWIDIRWEPANLRNALYLHTSLLNEKGNPQGTSVICRIEDSGQWQIDFDQLAELGLDIRNTSLDRGERSLPLRVELRRRHRFARAVPGFERISIDIERRAAVKVLHSIQR